VFRKEQIFIDVTLPSAVVFDIAFAHLLQKHEWELLEVVSKPQIRYKGKASGRSAVALLRASGYGGTNRQSAAYMSM
jgi:hypothetical protein